MGRTTIPYPSEHAARIRAPGKRYTAFRRQNNKFGEGIDVIFGVKSDGKTEVQAIRFDAKRFTPAQARQWLSDNNYKPTIFEPASGNKELTMPDEEVKEVAEKCGDYGMAMPAVPMGVTSFAQLQAAEAAEEATDEVHELASQFQGIVNNIMADMMLEDKAGAVTAAAAEFATLVDAAMSGREESKENGETVKAVWDTKFQNNLPDSSFLYVEDGQKDSEGKTVPRSKRHFVFADANGKVDLPHLRNAIARIPQSNAPGLSAAKKANLQEEARKKLAAANKEGDWLKDVLDKVGEFFGLHPKEAPVKSTSDLMLWKEGNRYRWLAVFTNKYRDKDNPPEILAHEAHKDFVSAIDRKEWAYPKLRHWHIKGSDWGEADWMHYDEQTGFNMACGLVDIGHEKEAEALAAAIEKGVAICVSHGMPVSEIRRDDKDATVITRYRSIEISDLPAWAAANPLTGFDILKEGTMPIPEQKKKYLKEVAGLNDDQIAAIEALPTDKAKQAEEEHLESKETPQVAPVEPVAETPAPAPDTPAPITREEIVAAIQSVISELEPRFAALEAGQKELKEAREVEAKDILAATPAFSIVEMLKSGGRAVGSPEAQVEKGQRVKGPKETKAPPEAGENVVGIPFISQMLMGGRQPA